MIKDILARILLDSEVYTVIEKLRENSLANHIKIFLCNPESKGIDGFINLNAIDDCWNIHNDLTDLLNISHDHEGYFEPFVLSRAYELWYRHDFSFSPRSRYNGRASAIIDAGTMGIPLMELGI